jgi:hemerythrin-like domain-containing protein
MDAIELLKQEHRMVKELFEQFEEAGERATRQRRTLVEKLTAALVPHMAVEEQHLYPMFRERGDEDDRHMALEAIEEHHVVKVLLKELEAMTPDDERYAAKVTVLQELVDHHIKEEEEEIFPVLAKATSREELAELGELLESRKKDVPARPDPDVVGIPATRRRTGTAERGRLTTRSLAARTGRAGTAKGRKPAAKTPARSTTTKGPAKKSPPSKSRGSRGKRGRGK